MNENQRAINFRKTQTLNLNKAAESWIIDTLQMDGRYQTLEEAQIDKKTLIAKGLEKSEIERVYKGLYVYSKGFNELLSQSIKQDDMNLKAILWKIFLILIERYNYSDYQVTMKGIIDQHYKEVKNVIEDNEAVGNYNKKLQEQLDSLQGNFDQKQNEWQQMVNQLQEQIDLMSEKYCLADVAAEKELEKRFRLENKTGQIRAQFNELIVRQQILLENLQQLQIQKDLHLSEIELLRLRNSQNSLKIEDQEIQIQQLKDTQSDNEQFIISKNLVIEEQETQIIKLRQQIIAIQQNNQKQLNQMNNQNAKIQEIIEQNKQSNSNKLKYTEIEECNRVIEQLQNEIYLKNATIENFNGTLKEQQLVSESIQEKYKQELLIFQIQVEQGKDKLTQLQQEFQEKQYNYGQLELKLQSQSNQHQDYLDKQIEYTDKINKVLIDQQEKIKDLQKEIESLKYDKAVANTMIENMKQDYEKQVKFYQSNIKNITKQKLQLQENLQLSQQQIIKQIQTAAEENEKHKRNEIQLMDQLQESKQNEALLQKRLTEQTQIYHDCKDDANDKFQQYQEFMQEKDQFLNQISQQTQKIAKLEKDNQKQTSEINWLDTQNNGFQEKLKKQQAIIRDQQKEVEGLKSDNATTQIMFEEMKMDFDDQIRFYQSNLSAITKQKQLLQEDLQISQQQIKKQMQIITDQSEKIKRNEIQLINQVSDAKQNEMMLSLKLQQQTLQSRNQTESKDDTVDTKNSQSMYRSLKENIAKKILQKIKLRRQQTQKVFKSTENNNEDNSFIDEITNDFENSNALEEILNTITIDQDLFNFENLSNKNELTPGIQTLPQIQIKQNDYISQTDSKPQTLPNQKSQNRVSRSLTKSETTYFQQNTPSAQINNQKIAMKGSYNISQQRKTNKQQQQNQSYQYQTYQPQQQQQQSSFGKTNQQLSFNKQYKSIDKNKSEQSDSCLQFSQMQSQKYITLDYNTEQEFEGKKNSIPTIHPYVKPFTREDTKNRLKYSTDKSRQFQGLYQNAADYYLKN